MQSRRPALLRRASSCLLVVTLASACAHARAPVGHSPEPSAADAVDTSERSIRIATFNIQVFGQRKSGKADVMAALGRICRKYDLIAVQELKDKSEQVPQRFLEVINRGGGSYAYVLSPRTGRQPDDRSSQEQYAYYYRTDRLRQVGEARLFDDSAHDYFQREPHLTRFRVIGSPDSFVLINIHTRPKAAVPEIAALSHVFAWARQQYPDEEDFIALGDFNAGCGYASEEDLDALPIHGEGYTWVIPHSVDTNLAPSSCAYDRIVIASPRGNSWVKEWGVDRAFQDRRISDHWPVWAEFVVRD